MNRRLLSFLAPMLALTSFAIGVSAADSPERQMGRYAYIEFDVAEKMAPADNRFSFDEAPVLENGLPAYGNAFITQGYIYPAGLLQGRSGIDVETGGPEFPNMVIGEWTCRGYFVGNGAATETGPIVITTQVYNFGDVPGEMMLVSEGYELADVGQEVKRAITGGTGVYRNVNGDVVQTLLGLNQSDGVNLRIRVRTGRR